MQNHVVTRIEEHNADKHTLIFKNWLYLFGRFREYLNVICKAAKCDPFKLGLFFLTCAHLTPKNIHRNIRIYVRTYRIILVQIQYEYINTIDSMYYISNPFWFCLQNGSTLELDLFVLNNPKTVCCLHIMWVEIE